MEVRMPENAADSIMVDYLEIKIGGTSFRLTETDNCLRIQNTGKPSLLAVIPVCGNAIQVVPR